MSRGEQRGGAGGLQAERWRQPGYTQTVPDQEEGGEGEKGVSGEETLLPLYRLREGVREILSPQSPPQGAYR